MSLRINDMAPDFTAETTQGLIHFHRWIGDELTIKPYLRTVRQPTE